jgi:putative membrane protein
MVRLMTTSALVAGLLVAPAAFAQTSHNPNASAGTASATASKETLTQQDRTFVKEAAEGGMAEVELSKLAEKSENPDVKRFAERMVQDHTKANTELTTIAGGLGAEMPKALDSEHQRIHDQLASVHGKAFDQRYMHVMVDDHNQAVKLFQEETNVGHNTQLNQFAHNTLPIIEQHQKMAIDLSRRLSETAAR